MVNKRNIETLEQLIELSEHFKEENDKNPVRELDILSELAGIPIHLPIFVPKESKNEH